MLVLTINHPRSPHGFICINKFLDEGLFEGAYAQEVGLNKD